MTMEENSLSKRSFKISEEFGLIISLLCVSVALNEEIVIKNDSYIDLELQDGNYGENQNWTWVLSQDTGFWALYFLQFSLAGPNPKTQICEYDFFKIWEIRDRRVHEDVYCGNQVRAGDTYYSTGPEVQLVLKSNVKNEMHQGIEIQAFHAKTQDKLQQKLRQHRKNKPVGETFKEPVRDDDDNTVEKKGPSLLIIGLCVFTVVVSVIFGILFIYCLIAKRLPRKPEKPEKLNDIVIFEDKQISPSGSSHVILLNTGRRYTREKH